MTPVVTLHTPTDNDTSNTNADTTPHGIIAIMSSTGKPQGFLNAEELTAFRTALSSSLLFTRRHHFKTLVVFGAGRQAYWHIRLALLMCGKPLKHIYIVNRSLSSRAKELLRAFIEIPTEVKEREGWSNVKFSVVTPQYGEYDRLLKEHLRAADCVITTVPSTVPLFSAEHFTSTEGRKRGRLFIAIGSYKPHMIELPVELLQQAVRPSHEHRHFHKHAEEGGVVIVDTLTGCLKEAGEIIQAGLESRQLVEVGELVMLEGELSNDWDTSVLSNPGTQSRTDTLVDGGASPEEEEPEVEKVRQELRKQTTNDSATTGNSGKDSQPANSAVVDDASSGAGTGLSGVFGKSTRSDSTTSLTGSRRGSLAQSGDLGKGNRTPSWGKSSRTSFSTSHSTGIASFGQRLRSMSIDLGGGMKSSLDGMVGGGSKKETKRSKDEKREGKREEERRSSSTNRNDVMARWLGKGNVIYKSVGMGLMDLVVGKEILMLARVRDIGVSVEDF